MAGKLQNEDFKTEAEAVSAGGTAANLLNDSKIWVTGGSINKTLNDAIADGDIGGGDVNSVNGQTGVVLLNVTTGSRASPTAITAAGGISAPLTTADQLRFIQGSGGAVNITSSPQIGAGLLVGQKIIFIGRSDTNTVTFEDGTGLSMNGQAELGSDSTLEMIWDGTNWVEISRSV